MDRMRACGVCDVGSIPTEGTKKNKIKKFNKKLVFLSIFYLKI